MIVMRYDKHIDTEKKLKAEVPQTQKIPGTNQTRNHAGGFSFNVDDLTRLDRFLILGTEGGTYYQSERNITRENAKVIEKLIVKSGKEVVQRVVEISQAGRAPKNDPAIFVLAMALKLGDAETKKEAQAAVTKVCRTGTHLFHLAQYVEAFGGWGRGTQTAFRNWYLSKNIDNLAYQAVKYQSRDGWSHRDILRLTHIRPTSEEQNAVFKWIVKDENPAFGIISAFEEAKKLTPGSSKDRKRLIALIKEHGLPHEAIPTEWKKDPDVWEAMLSDMGITALVRNLANMTRIGLLNSTSKATGVVLAKLEDKDLLKKSKIHPIQMLSAFKTYSSGHGVRGGNSWVPVQTICDALNDGFYNTFSNVTPTGKRWMLGCDVSASMAWGEIAGVPGLNPRIGTAAMAMVTARTERLWEATAFSDRLVNLPISPKHRLDSTINTMEKIPMGGTDCALPMLYALENKKEFDVFVVYTDNETWHGKVHPVQALKKYRDKMGINAKLIVVGFTATEFSIADPNDKGMLDVVGFDSAVPALMNDFVSW